MKKYTIKLVGGTKVILWAKDLKEAIAKAEDDYGQNILGIEDNSKFNGIELPEDKHDLNSVLKSIKQSQGVVSWNTEMLARFKLRLNVARQSNQDVFQFDGHDFVTRYAEYLAEYLTRELYPQGAPDE